MSGSAGIITGIAVARSGVTCLARILGNAGTPITIASITSITYTVRDLTAGSTVAAAQALTVASVIFDSLQQADPRWDKDDVNNVGRDGRYGYNFAAVIPAADFTVFDVGDATVHYEVTPHVMQIDVRFVPVSGEAFIVPFRCVPVPTYVA